MTFKIPKIQKDIVTALCKDGKNIMLIGPTGCGKTSFCSEIAEEAGLNLKIFNCGSTQDARTSLLGYFSLEDGSTKFHMSDFVDAIQTPNTLIVLDEISRASDDAYNILFPLLDFRREISVEEQEGTKRNIKAHPSVRFVGTANIGVEYSATRSIDRALQDRFMFFSLRYVSGTDLSDLIFERNPDLLQDAVSTNRVKSLIAVYDAVTSLYGSNNIQSNISPRMILARS